MHQICQIAPQAPILTSSNRELRGRFTLESGENEIVQTPAHFAGVCPVSHILQPQVRRCRAKKRSTGPDAQEAAAGASNCRKSHLNLVKLLVRLPGCQTSVIRQNKRVADDVSVAVRGNVHNVSESCVHC
jgi:hypothetical protein